MVPAVLQEQVLRKFIPAELIPPGWSCQERSLIENIRSLYEASNTRIQIYGCPKNLESQLINFMSFPGSQQFFQFDDSTFYRTYLPAYYSLRGNSYIYKEDIHELLFEYVPKIHTLPPLQKLAHNLMSYYLRSMKKKLPSSHEMILIDDEFRISLLINKQSIEKVMECGEWRKKEVSSDSDPKDTDDVLNDLGNMLMGSEFGSGMSEEMRKTVIMVTKDLPVNENGFAYRNMLAWFYGTFRGFEGFISRNKSLMLSRSETVDSFPASRILVRLFESEQEKVVMSHELLHAIKLEKLDVSGFEDKILALPNLSAISFREVFEMVPSNICKLLEFIRVPLCKASETLHMIPTIDGSYCLNAYQFFVKIFSDVVFVKKAFQGMKREQWPHIMGEFHAMLANTLCNENYFISYEEYEETKLFLGAWFERNFPSPNQEEISNVSINGFTCEDLKNQLERLELSEIFPHIGQVALKMSANRNTFGCLYDATQQMLQLIQDTQFSYIFSLRSEHFLTIFHKRKWCVKMLPRCSLCFEEQSNEPSIKTAEEFSVSVESKAVEERENLNEIVINSSDIPSLDQALETSSTEKSDDSKTESLSPSTPNEKKVVEKPKPVQKSKKPKKKMEKSVVKPEVKESQSCPKCIRASEYTIKTNEQLRLSKIEVKHLKKELSVVELALEEKNERIRMLEEKLREQENQLNLKSTEVETLETKNHELEKKNKRNERLIATFPEVVSKKDKAIKSWQHHNYEKERMIEELLSEKSEATPSRSAEESEKVDSVLSSLLETKKILSKENPVRKSSGICEALIAKTNSEVTQQMVKYETKVFQLQVSSYIQIVENNIQLIRGNKTIKFDQISKTPDFPEFSKEFKNVYMSIMNEEAPLLCRQLVNLTDEIADMECLICITEMESHNGTTKCVHCKRRYHNHCITSWLKMDSICPACKNGMVDEQEFPAL